MKLKTILLIRVSLLYFTFTACPIPINTEMVDNLHDKISPEIEIFTPDEDTPCANIVEVRGKVWDFTSKGQKGRIKQLSYQVPGFDIGSDIFPESNGTFFFLFETLTLGTRFTLKLSAIDWNNNIKEISLSLHKIEDNGIPSFQAEPGNHEITLKWDDIPGTESYNVFYTTNNSQPHRENGTVLPNVTSPLKLKNLQNGYAHNFILETTPKDGFPESRSNTLTVIPLSAQNLTPRVFGEYQQITVEWNSIDGTEEFEVWRAFNPEGPFGELSGPIEGNSFTETDITDNRWRYYKVRPALKGSIFSHAAGAQASPFSEKPQYVSRLSFETGHENDINNDLQDVAYHDSHLYIADKNGKLYIVNVSNPQSPQLIKPIIFTSACFEVVISGQYAYAACYEAGLQIIDISHPKEARVVSSIDIESSTYGITVSDNFAYIAEYNGKLHIVDISDPLSPSKKKPIEVPGSPYKVAVADSFAYVVSKGYGVHVIDIEDPDTPKIVNTIESGSDCYDIAIQENYAYIADGSGVYVVDIQDPIEAEIDQNNIITTLDYAFDIKVKNNRAYVAENQRGFQIIDITNPESASVIHSLETNGRARGIAVSDTHAFIAAGRANLQIFTISSPHYPVIRKKKLPLNNSPRNLTIHNNKLYVPMRFANMQIFDINSPFIESFFNTDIFFAASDIAFSGPYAFIAGEYEKFRIIDMNHQGLPKKIRALDSFEIGNPSKVFIAGANAFLVGADEGVHLIDINNPESAYIIQTIKTPNSPLSVAIKGNYAYIADSLEGIFVSDISNLLSAVADKKIESTEGVTDIIISGDYAYAINNSKGLQIISLQNPASPTIVHTVEKLGHPAGFDISGFYAYVASRNDGLYIINIKDLEDPKVIASIKDIGYLTAVHVTGSQAFVSTGNMDNKIMVIDLLPYKGR